MRKKYQKSMKKILISILVNYQYDTNLYINLNNLHIKMNDPMVEFDPYGAISTGTTIMAIIYDGGLLIGADSRTTSG